MSETNNPTVTLPLEFAWQVATLTNLALTYLDDQVNEARNMKWRIGMYKKLKEADTIHNELKAYIAEAENGNTDVVTNCREPEGITVGLIDAIITLARTIRTQVTEDTPPVIEAMLDLGSDEDLTWILERAKELAHQQIEAE